jgi:hypothetical protein
MGNPSQGSRGRLRGDKRSVCGSQAGPLPARRRFVAMKIASELPTLRFESSGSRRLPSETSGILQTMKKTSPTKTSSGTRAEYRFDYSKAKPNRFASQTKEGSIAALPEESPPRKSRSRAKRPS